MSGYIVASIVFIALVLLVSSDVDNVAKRKKIKNSVSKLFLHYLELSVQVAIVIAIIALIIVLIVKIIW